VKVFTAIVLLAAVLPLRAADENQTFVGEVVEVSKGHIELDQGRSTVSIGFALDTNAVSALESIKVGHEVRAVFGAMHNSDSQLINKLISIRICALEDKECAADRARQDKEGKELDQRLAASNLTHERCRQAMRVTLANDQRYVPEGVLPESERIRAKYNALAGERRSCASEVLRQHASAVFEACELHQCGDNVGGGCSHIVGYATTNAAIEKAVEKCGGDA
jgi:hypothetical protein